MGQPLQPLHEEECRRLLATRQLGRVAVVVGGLPHVFPVNYALDGDDLVFRSGPGTKLDVALHGAPVAFEIDHEDPLYHGGWSVVASGVASVVVDADEAARLDALPLRPWANQRGTWRWVRIRVLTWSGRRLGRVNR